MNKQPGGQRAASGALLDSLVVCVEKLTERRRRRRRRRSQTEAERHVGQRAGQRPDEHYPRLAGPLTSARRFTLRAPQRYARRP